MRKINHISGFCFGLEKVVDLQDKQSYEKFLEIFEKCMSVLWAYRTDEALASIEQQCYSISYCLLGSEKKR